MANDLGSTLVRALAQARWPDAPLFVVTAESNCPEAQIQRGDRVIYALATPALNEAVVWSSKDGAVHFGRIKKGGLVLEGGKIQTPSKHKGVVVAVLAAA